MFPISFHNNTSVSVSYEKWVTLPSQNSNAGAGTIKISIPSLFFPKSV
jgi:hypothetical protein